MKHRVPSAFPINDRWIKVRYVDSLVDKEGNHLYGETIVDDLIIRVSKTMCKSAQDIFETVFHELDHVAFQLSGLAHVLGEEKEEAVAHARQYTLAKLFVFSPNAGIRYRLIEFPWGEE